MFSISVCMIVKNEEDVLERILSCAKQFADEIIIVDTGSTDKTKEIAQKFSSKVFDFTWQDDFSKARNFSFSKATCDYQMWLDADDYISASEIKQINLLKSSNENADVFMFKYAISFDDNNNPTFLYDRERLLKRSKNFQWQGFVHEAIVPRGKVSYKDIIIEHRKLHVTHPKRNLKLYQKALKQGVTFSAREQYYYSRELYFNNHIQSAIKSLKRYLKIQNTYAPDNSGAYLLLADCFVFKKEFKKAKDAIFKCLDTHIPTAEMCCKLAYVYESLKKDENAIFWFKAALSCKKQTQGFIQKDYESIIPCLELTKLYYHLNDIEMAKHFHSLCMKQNPQHPSVVFNEKFFNSLK